MDNQDLTICLQGIGQFTQRLDVMKPRIINNRILAIAHDIAMVPVAWLAAFWLRFNMGAVPAEASNAALGSVLVVIVVQAFAFQYYGLYRGVWRFASIPDLVRIVKSVLVGVAFSAVIVFLMTRMEGVPRSTFPLYGLLLITFLGGSRLLVRWSKDRRLYGSGGKRVLIVGAGKAGEMMARDLLRSRDENYEIVGFVDDSRSKRGREIHGVRVLGPCDELIDFSEYLGVDLILLALPSATSKQMRRLVDLCEKTGVPFRTLPPMDRLMAGDISLSHLREVSIDDLLGREPVTLDWKQIRSELQGKRVLVTGAGGSIGSELCRQIAGLVPSQIILLDNGEFNLYSIEREILEKFPAIDVRRCLNSVVDRTAIAQVFELFSPEVIFHAAAYKHVPMLEDQIREALKNNVLGTRVMAEFADRYGCDAFVMISTDKAVNPANVMGASKRAAEVFCQNLNARSRTRFVTVRFGNVLGSAGSVVPLFKKQIESGGPVTVTHREITRYFMTIPEACQLILQASAMGKGGEIFVLDMGESVKISFLADQMIRLSGKTPGEDIDIVYTGLRPGEKLYEELFHKKEALQSTLHEKILLARHRELDWDELVEVLDRIADACVRGDVEQLQYLLGLLVPEWTGSVSSDPHAADESKRPSAGELNPSENATILH